MELKYGFEADSYEAHGVIDEAQDQTTPPKSPGPLFSGWKLGLESSCLAGEEVGEDLIESIIASIAAAILKWGVILSS